MTAPFTDNGVTEKQYSDPQRVTLDTEIRLNLIGPTWLTGPGKVFVYAGANVLAPSDWAVDGHKSTLGIGGDVLLVACLFNDTPIPANTPASGSSAQRSLDFWPAVSSSLSSLYLSISIHLTKLPNYLA